MECGYNNEQLENLNKKQIDNSSDVKNLAKRSTKIKNLEQEVELIFSQEKNFEDCEIADDKSDDKSEKNSRTPSHTGRLKVTGTPSASKNVLQEFLQTPRRSSRKSIKPSQDYEDIVSKSLISISRSSKKSLLVVEECAENRDVENAEPKWTPAKVGRVSQKRSRKSKRSGRGRKGKSQIAEEDNPNKTVFEVVEQISEIDPFANDAKDENVIDVVLKPNEISTCAVSKIQIGSYNKSKENMVENPINVQEKHENINVEHKSSQENEVESEFNNELHNDLNLSNESVHLVQEDSEDGCNFGEKSEQDKLCIIYENNISNNELRESIKNDFQSLSLESSEGKGEIENCFGSYLKSKDINISDLGLNPLLEEEEINVNDTQAKSSSQEKEEMPSLIMCDGDEEMQDNKPCNNLNETFEANDCVELEEIFESVSKQNEEIMESLLFSDDDVEIPEKRVHSFIRDTELENDKISTPSGSKIKAKLSSTPILPCTPNQSKKPIRFPTPYRYRQNFDPKQELKENIKKTPGKKISNVPTISLTTLEPKEIVLRGIRKRSLSVCIDGNEEKRRKFTSGHSSKMKQDRTVSFYSPANQTALIDDLDTMIAKSLKNQKAQDKQLISQFVTTRRKRSLSLDESAISTSLLSKLPRPVVSQNIANNKKQSSSMSKPASRTKLPNFAAIHQKQFQKMENLVEHVNRKQERSKILINSATKIKTASAQKSVSALKSSNVVLTEKSKALKRIDLGTMRKINNSLLNTTSTTVVHNITAEVTETHPIRNLPDPRLGAVKCIKPGGTAGKSSQQQQIKYLKTSKTTNAEKPRLNFKTLVPSKPTFNLSTSLMVKPTTSSSFIEKFNTTQVSNDDKMTSRLQRHMDLYKGRAPTTRAGATSRRNEVILKGVRSNRRFELQMQHRKNLEQ